jgi:hypothetical protein
MNKKQLEIARQRPGLRQPSGAFRPCVIEDWRLIQCLRQSGGGPQHSKTLARIKSFHHISLASGHS